MKKSTLLFIFSSFISHAGFSDTYVWQDYDDFSGSNLDTRKWEIGYWDGAQAPNIENGKAHLYGTGVGVGSIVPPSFDELVGMPQNGINQSFLFLKDDLIRGVEAEISLDSTFSGIYLGIMEAVVGGFAYAGIELNSWKQSGPSLEFSNTIYENGTETLELTLGDKPANLGQSYKVSVVKGESAYQLFLDSELIGEYPVRGELLFFSFGGYHDEDLPWDGYIDNVRVISDWEEYEDFSSGTDIDTDRWSMGHWDGGNLPIVENERLTLTGNTISGFNEVLPTAGMLEFNPDIKPLLEEGFSSSNGTESHSILELIKDDILGIEVEVQLPADAPSSVAIGLYASDWAKAFSEDQSDKSFFGLDLWRDHIDIEYVDPNTGEFISSELSTTAASSHTFAFIFEDGKVFMFVDGGKVAEFSSANFSRDSIVIRAWNTAGEPFSAYAQNVRVLRRSHETTEPNPVTVVSDPNGQVVVVQVGDAYKWSSSLDGVTLWGVEKSSDGWTSTTMRFENGRNFGNEGFYDSVAQPQPYDVTFEIDENGYIKSLEDDGDYQYYNPVSVENGVIGTIQNDEGVDSVANNGINQVDQWFFTTRAAAEEYYYSKVNPKSWMWFDHYPWVYSEEEQGWLYFYPSGGKLLYYSNKSQVWREFNQ